MYEKILVPVVFDHGKSAPRALTAARRLASESAQIILFHVLEDIPAYVEAQIPAEIIADTQKKAKEELEAAAGAAGSDVTVSLVKGHASRAILDYAEENGVDCIVISSHHPGLEDYFLGSTAARVVRHAQCSVHVLR